MRESGTEKERAERGMNRDWCQWKVMYWGEGDESEPASLSAPVVMSFSKTSLIFNGAWLQERRENRNCTHAHTHIRAQDSDICRQCGKLQTCTKCRRAHAHVHFAAQMQTRFSEKLMELRHRGLEAGCCTQQAREGGKKRDEEHRHSCETHAGGKQRTPERQVEDRGGTRAKAKLGRAMSEDGKKKNTHNGEKGNSKQEELVTLEERIEFLNFTAHAPFIHDEWLTPHFLNPVSLELVCVLLQPPEPQSFFFKKKKIYFILNLFDCWSWHLSHRHGRGDRTVLLGTHLSK